MKLKWKIAIVAGAICLTSCAQILGDLLFPNYCQECKVISMSGYVEWSEEECGGGQDDMETRCKAMAYDKGYGAKCECNFK